MSSHPLKNIPSNRAASVLPPVPPQDKSSVLSGVSVLSRAKAYAAKIASSVGLSKPASRPYLSEAAAKAKPAYSGDPKVKTPALKPLNFSLTQSPSVYREQLNSVKSSVDSTQAENLLATETDSGILTRLLDRSARGNLTLSSKAIDGLLAQRDLNDPQYVFSKLAKSPDVTSEQLAELAKRYDTGVVAATLVAHDNVSEKTLTEFAQQRDNIPVKKAIVDAAKAVLEKQGYDSKAFQKYRPALQAIHDEFGDKFLGLTARNLLAEEPLQSSHPSVVEVEEEQAEEAITVSPVATEQHSSPASPILNTVESHEEEFVDHEAQAKKEETELEEFRALEKHVIAESIADTVVDMAMKARPLAAPNKIAVDESDDAASSLFHLSEDEENSDQVSVSDITSLSRASSFSSLSSLSDDELNVFDHESPAQIKDTSQSSSPSPHDSGIDEMRQDSVSPNSASSEEIKGNSAIEIETDAPVVQAPLVLDKQVEQSIADLRTSAQSLRNDLSPIQGSNVYDKLSNVLDQIDNMIIRLGAQANRHVHSREQMLQGAKLIHDVIAEVRKEIADESYIERIQHSVHTTPEPISDSPANSPVQRSHSENDSGVSVSPRSENYEFAPQMDSKSFARETVEKLLKFARSDQRLISFEDQLSGLLKQDEITSRQEVAIETKMRNHLRLDKSAFDSLVKSNASSKSPTFSVKERVSAFTPVASSTVAAKPLKLRTSFSTIAEGAAKFAAQYEARAAKEQESIAPKVTTEQPVVVTEAKVAELPVATTSAQSPIHCSSSVSSGLDFYSDNEEEVASSRQSPVEEETVSVKSVVADPLQQKRESPVDNITASTAVISSSPRLLTPVSADAAKGEPRLEAQVSKSLPFGKRFLRVITFGYYNPTPAATPVAAKSSVAAAPVKKELTPLTTEQRAAIPKLLPLLYREIEAYRLTITDPESDAAKQFYRSSEKQKVWDPIRQALDLAATTQGSLASLPDCLPKDIFSGLDVVVKVLIEELDLLAPIKEDLLSIKEIKGHKEQAVALLNELDRCDQLKFTELKRLVAHSEKIFLTPTSRHNAAVTLGLPVLAIQNLSLVRQQEIGSNIQFIGPMILRSAALQPAKAE